MTYKPSSQSGFTLVETLVAITILLLVIVGPMSFSMSAARSTSFSTEQTAAFFLAQEGIEIMQKARDDLVLGGFADPGANPDPWDDFSDDSTGALYENCFVTNSATGCGLELNDDATGSIKAPIDCSSVSCRLYYDDTGDRARYTYTSTDPDTITPYTRTITLSNNAGNTETEVVSRVSWRTGSQRAEQEVVSVTYLFDVYGN